MFKAGFKKMIAPDVEELSKYLHSRKPPMEPEAERQLVKDINQEVMNSGKKPDSEPDWPRIIRPVLVRHRHAICRMCTSQGKLTEVIFTPGKHGKLMYTCARHSKWGDRLPVSLEDIQNSENRPIMETED
ncbi:unnamed protein product [Nesidiocoris tenuis]|uniref:Uncharacterized protein n=1 Tax=Nesidiocoris tenuis TaxID=355587 RepID=A0A6H5H0B1_9HEMI|nr:unnamed protein product [Nesidiocoris tenuis]